MIVHQSDNLQKIIVLKPKVALIRALNRKEAADYIGVSFSKFDEMAQDDRMDNQSGFSEPQQS
jgi:hypothetical protein